MKPKTSTWIFNPSIYIAGWTSMALGWAIMIATAVTGYFSNTHLDGVIGAGFGLPAPLWLYLVEAAVAWLSLCLTLFIAARIVSKTSFRLVDLMGTQALARAPMFIVPFLGFPEAGRKVTRYLLYRTLGLGEETTATYADIVLFILITIIMILVVIWMIVLMYNSYKVSCNLKGTKAGVSFTLALILAQAIASAFFMLAFKDIYLNPEGLNYYLN